MTVQFVELRFADPKGYRQEECSICLNPFCEEDALVVHSNSATAAGWSCPNHLGCLNESFKYCWGCPLCKKAISDESVNKAARFDLECVPEYEEVPALDREMKPLSYREIVHGVLATVIPIALGYSGNEHGTIIAVITAALGCGIFDWPEELSLKNRIFNVICGGAVIGTVSLYTGIATKAFVDIFF